MNAQTFIFFFSSYTETFLPDYFIRQLQFLQYNKAVIIVPSPLQK